MHGGLITNVLMTILGRGILHSFDLMPKARWVLLAPDQQVSLVFMSWNSCHLMVLPDRFSRVAVCHPSPPVLSSVAFQVRVGVMTTTLGCVRAHPPEDHRNMGYPVSRPADGITRSRT